MESPRTSRKRALLIGPLPPPVGGDTVLTEHLAGCGCWERLGIGVETIDTSAGDQVRVQGQRLSARDLLRGVRVLCVAFVGIPRSRIVLLWANSRFALTAGLLIVTWCLVLRRPVFLKVFGGCFAKHLARLSTARRVVTLRIIRSASCILAETHSLVRSLIDEGFPPDRVVHFSNYLVSPAEGGPAPPKPFTGACVFFGQIKREKGVFDIIEAIGGREGISCDFYGPFLERDRVEFLEALEKHPNLAYRGVAQPGTVSSVARSYDLLLLPTFHEGEGYPAVILEAYAAGMPVVASRWLSIPEIVEDGETGLLVPPHDPAAIVEAILSIRSDPARYERMCARAAERSRSFTSEAIVEGVLFPRILDALDRGRGGR